MPLAMHEPSFHRRTGRTKTGCAVGVGNGGLAYGKWFLLDLDPRFSVHFLVIHLALLGWRPSLLGWRLFIFVGVFDEKKRLSTSEESCSRILPKRIQYYLVGKL